MSDAIDRAVEEALRIDPDSLAAIYAGRKVTPTTCPRCRGEKTINAKRTRYNPASWSRPARIPCPTCEGTGTI